MQDQEIADAIGFRIGDAVEFGNRRGIEIAVRKQADELGDIGLNEVNRSRFKRFEKAAGQANRDDIAVPVLFAAASAKAHEAWIAQRCAIEARGQEGRCCVILHELAGIDITIADAVLQRDAPLPACFTRSGAGVGRGRPCTGAGHGHRAITRQPVAPVLKPRLERAFDQQRAQARAIDEEIRLQLASAFQRHAFDEARFAVERNIVDLAFHAGHTARFGMAAQVCSIERRIEMVGIIEG